MFSPVHDANRNVPSNGASAKQTRLSQQTAMGGRKPYKRQMSVEEEIEELKPQVDRIKRKLAVAEAVARASMMTPAGASARLAFRKMQIEGSSEEYVPPRMVLLYLVRWASRMGLWRFADRKIDKIQFSCCLVVV